jgi:hypothetical protein
MRACNKQSLFFDSDKLSKSKPLGILRLVPPGIILTVDACSRQQEENLHMFARLIQICSAFLFAYTLAASSPVLAGDDGIITVKSAYPIGETIERLKRDIADKGIKFFDEIDQSKLAADAGNNAPPISAVDLWEPTARDAIYHRKRECWTRLASAASRLRE